MGKPPELGMEARQCVDILRVHMLAQDSCASVFHQCPVSVTVSKPQGRQAGGGGVTEFIEFSKFSSFNK